MGHKNINIKQVFFGQICFFFLQQSKSQQNWKEDTELSHVPLVSHTRIASPIITILARAERTSVTIDEVLWHIIITQSPLFTLVFTFGVVHSMSLEKFLMMCIHYCNIIQSILTALKILCSTYSFPPALEPLATTYLFTIFIVQLFPKYYTIGIMQYVTFSDWCLSLSKMHFSFLHVFSFSWLNHSFIF